MGSDSRQNCPWLDSIPGVARPASPFGRDQTERPALHSLNSHQSELTPYAILAVREDMPRKFSLDKLKPPAYVHIRDRALAC